MRGCLLVVLACGGSTTSVRLVAPSSSVNVDDCVLVSASGGHVISARCADETICDIDQVGASSVLVRGKAAGTTSVEVDYERSDGAGRGSGKLPVTFASQSVDALHPQVTNSADACPTRREQMGR